MAAMPRPPHRGAHINDRPPPSLPPRSGGRAVRPLPAHPPSIDSDTDPDDYLEPDSTRNAPEEIYDDCNENDDLPAAPDEVYDDCGDRPPLPPLPVSQPEEFYDDFDEQPKPPARPPAKLPPLMMQPPQENYDDLDNVGPVVVQKLPRVRQPPPSPAPPPPVQGIVEDVYEDPDASQPATPPHRGPSPPRNPPPGRSWAKVPEPSTALRATSPGRNKSPSRLHERFLPPIPPSKENRTQPGDPRSHPLPPIPPEAGASARGGSPARSASPAPIPAARGNRRKSPDHQGQYSKSPVVVPLKQRHAKGDLPPLPPGPASEEEDDDDDSGGGMTLQDNGGAENYAEDFDAEDPTASHDLHEESEADENSDEEIPTTDSESEEFPPPPSPLLKRTGMLASSHSHPHSPPPLPSTLPPSSYNHSDDVYEVNFGEPQSGGSYPPPPPPPPPPKEQSRPLPARLPPQPKAPAPSSAPSGPGSFAIDLGQLKDLRAGLRKVSVGAAQDSSAAGSGSTDPKVYGECAPNVASAKRMFQDKAIGKPGVSAPKPAITPKFGTWKGPGNDGSNNNNSTSTVVRPPLRSTSPKPPLPPPSLDKPSSQVPDVTFLPKPNKDKHTNVPTLNKPVTKYEPPPPEETFESDDIYDDAASVDTMQQYDWYHGYLDRKPAEAKVKAIGKDGTYLVRVSEKDPRFPYTLVVLQKGHVNNLRIRQRSDNKFALGDEKADELTFPDVPALIKHHQNHHVVLLGGGSQSQVVLQITPPKS